MASDPYYTEASGTLAAETMAYITMIEDLRTTGQPAPGAETFTFSEPSANSPLFDPYAVARRTVADALGTDLCQDSLAGGEIFTYATTATVATPLGDPLATSAHITAIEEGSATADVSVGFSGGDLVSIGLPLETVTEMPPEATAYSPDPITAAWIADVEAMTVAMAATFDPSTDVQHRLLGQPRDVEALADAVWTYSTDTWSITPDDILVLEARFGIYGSLPMLVVWYDEGYFLVDGVNGVVAGPYLEGTQFDPGDLLDGHVEYEPGTGYRVIDSATGCTHTGLGKRWRDTPPEGPLSPRPGFYQPGPWREPPNPPLPKPNFPEWPYTPCGPVTSKNYPTAPNENRDRNGWPTDWKCTSPPAADGTVVCGTLETWLDPYGRIVIRGITCTLNDSTSPNGRAPNNGPPHNSPRDYDSQDPDTGEPNNMDNVIGDNGEDTPNCIDRWYY